MENLIWLVPVIAVIALAYAIVLTQVIKKKEIGTDRMKEISGAIKEGAQAFLFAEYKILVIFIVVLFVLIGLFTGSDGIATGWMTAVCFLIGAIFSIIAGYIGMNVATDANVRTANAAKQGGMSSALDVAYKGGSVMGLCVVGLGLVGVSNLSDYKRCRYFIRIQPWCILYRIICACRWWHLHKGSRRRC